MVFPNLNVVGHLTVPAGWGSYLPRLAIFHFISLFYEPAVVCTVLSQRVQRKEILLYHKFDPI